MAIEILSKPTDEILEQFTINLAEHASFGQSDADNGLILFVFPQHGLARLEIVYGLERAIPDVLAYRLLTDGLKPAWQAAHYAQAIDGTVDAFIALSRGEFTAAKEPVRLERMVRSFGIGRVMVAKQAWPMLRAVSPWHPVIVSFLAAFILIDIADDVRQRIALTRNMGSAATGNRQIALRHRFPKSCCRFRWRARVPAAHSCPV